MGGAYIDFYVCATPEGKECLRGLSVKALPVTEGTGLYWQSATRSPERTIS